eukprot:5210853-Pleurochrysis_carterae.AAC.1
MSSQRRHRCFHVAVVAAYAAPLPSLLARRRVVAACTASLLPSLAGRCRGHRRRSSAVVAVCKALPSPRLRSSVVIAAFTAP